MTKRNKPVRWPTSWRGWLIFVIFVAILYALNQRADVRAPTSDDLPERITARCVNVIDGDTLDVTFDGKRERIRLLGIDCMEGHNESKQSQQARTLGLGTYQVGKLSKEAGRWLKQRTLREDVQLVFDPGTPRRGGYDRLLCYVEHHDMDVSLELLKQGLAESRREPHSRKRQYDQAAREAKAARKGIWANQ